MKIRYHYRKLANPNWDLLVETAYHEAGHICFSYLADFKVIYAKVELRNPGNGSTQPDYLNFSGVTSALLDIKTKPEIFEELFESQRTAIPGVTHRLIDSIVAGPIAEARYKGLKNGYEHVVVSIENSDRLQCQTIITGLNSVFLRYNIKPWNGAYVEGKIQRVAEIMTLDEIWKCISALAEAMLSKKSGIIKNLEIEQILHQNDFFKLKKSL